MKLAIKRSQRSLLNKGTVTAFRLRINVKNQSGIMTHLLYNCISLLATPTLL